MVPSAEATEETAQEFVAEFGEAAFDEATDHLTDEGRERVAESFPDETPEDPEDATEALEAYWWGLYAQHGAFEAVGDVAVADGEATVELRFAAGNEVATVAVDEDGVAGLGFDPAYEVPGYVDRDAFDEHEVTVDASVALEGVLAVPDGDGPFPGVLLVHGHGLHDPDGTAGASKILKDLAWGLATEGIASLRYEKRLAEHEVPDEAYTIDRVVVDDAVAAAAELAHADAVDADSVFVAGHSQGGTCAPRIADRYGGAAGVVILDGLADPLADPDDLAFLRYSMEPDGDLDAEQEAELEERRETFRRVARGEYDPDETVMGLPGTWYDSYHEYDPAAAASDLDAPVFVLKTGRADEELQPELHEQRRAGYEEWAAVDLPPGSRAEFYEDVDHYFQAGPTPVTPTTLYFGGNVAAHVLADLAEWIHDTADG